MVVILLTRARRFSVEPTVRSDIDLTPNNRFYPVFLGGLIKFDGAVHHTVIGDRHGAESKITRLFQQAARSASTVQQ